MGAQTAIAWCDHTFNPWMGCTKVSPGCDSCYAEKERPCVVYGIAWGPHGKRRLRADSGWREPLTWHRKAMRAGVRRRVFCASLGDAFDNQAPDEWRARLWELIRETPALDWLLLTKRPQNAARMLPADWGDGYSNAWLGVTAENQTEFDRRWPILASLPARVRFISYEPAIGPLSLGDAKPDWLICGAEKGPGNKPLRAMPIEWARAIKDDCDRNGVVFFMKQMEVAGRVSDELAAFPEYLQRREWPKCGGAE